MLLNASPDHRQQIDATPACSLRRRGRLRDSPIKAVGADQRRRRSHCRPAQPARSAAAHASTRRSGCWQTLAANSVFNVLAAELVPRRELPLDKPVAATMRRRPSLGLTVEAFPVPGKVALYLEDATAGPGFGTASRRHHRARDQRSGHGRALLLHSRLRRRRRRHRSPGSQGAPLVFFDGTLYTDDEMIVQGLSSKTGKRMGHISMSGPEGSIAAFARARREAAHLRAHQQLQSGPARGQPRARGRTSEPAGRSASTAWRSGLNELAARSARGAGGVRGGDPRRRRRALSRQAPVPSPAARRQARTRARCRPGRLTATATRRRAAQGCRPDEPRPRPRAAPRVDAPHARPRRHGRRGRAASSAGWC